MNLRLEFSMVDPQDPFSRANYRSLIAWGPRIEREAPFLQRSFETLPDRSLLDLGCGTGEHARFFAGLGYRVVGLDASESMLQAALEEPLPANLRFVHGDLREADRVSGERFGGSLCLGNTLSFLLSEEDLARTLAAIARLLLPGGSFLFQILNYERLYARGERYLPLNFRPAEDGEIVFLRLLELREGGRVVFMPTTLHLKSESEEPVRLVHTRRAELRGWTQSELLPALEKAGFDQVRVFGSMTGDPLDAQASPDLVVLGSKGASGAGK